MPVPSAAALIPRSLLRDGVYRRLREAIVDGTLEPEEQLRDGELAAWLGVSRTPVREALLRLGQVGLVQTRPGHSTTVAPIDREAVREAGAVVAAMHRTAVVEAVPRLTEADLADLRAAHHRFAAAIEAGDADAALAADDDFHAVPVRVAGNRAVAAVLEEYAPVLRRVERLRFSSVEARISVARHARLLDLCVAGETGAAAEVAAETWHSLDGLLDRHPPESRPTPGEEAR